MTISVKSTIFDVAPINFDTTDLFENLNTYLPYQELFFVNIFVTNRHFEDAQMCPPKWAFSVITVFLYSGRWKTHFLTFEKRIRPQG